MSVRLLSVKGKGNFSGTAVVKFAITAATFTASLDQSEFTYDASEHTVTPTVVFSGTSTPLNASDYSVSGTLSATDAGTYTVTITGGSNFGGKSISLNWTINKATLTASLDKSLFTYSATEQAPVVSVLDSYGNVVSDGFSVAGQLQATNVGSYVITVTPGENYISSVINLNWSIAKAVLSVTGNDLSLTYGDARPSDDELISVSGLLGSDALSDAITGLSVSTAYQQWSNVADAPFEVSLSGASSDNYDFSLSNGTISLVKANIADASVADLPDQACNGAAIEPDLSISFKGRDLVLGTDYQVSFADNVYVGTATATITGIGNFTGSTIFKFNISGSKYSWIGTASVDWFTDSNWAGGQVPDADADVVIGDGCSFYPVISGDVSDVALANSLTIVGSSDDAVLTLDPGARLFVTDKVVVNHAAGRHIVINHRYDLMSSFVAKSIVDADGNEYSNVVVNRTVLSLVSYYLGSATKQGSIESGFDMAFCAPYDPVSASYDMSMTGSNDFSASYTKAFSLGIVSDDTESTFTQVGSILSSSSAAPEVALENQLDQEFGFNLLSNPYPYTIPLASQFFNVTSDADPVVWFPSYDPVSDVNLFKTVNLATGVAVSSDVSASDDQLLLPAAQGFFVRKNSSASDQSFQVDGSGISASDISTSGVHLKDASVESDVLRLTLRSNGDANVDEVALVFRLGGSDDAVYGDAVKMELSSDKNSIAARKGDEILSIPFFPEVASLNVDSIPLSVRLADGMTRGVIQASNIDLFDADVDVYLVDNLLGNRVNLREADSYSFSSANKSISLDDRFAIELSLVAGSQSDAPGSSLTATSDQVDSRIRISLSDDNLVKISVSDDVLNSSAVATVYDLSGRRVASSPISSSVTLLPLGDARSVYIVEVVSAGKVARLKLRSH